MLCLRLNTVGKHSLLSQGDLKGRRLQRSWIAKPQHLSGVSLMPRTPSSGNSAPLSCQKKFKKSVPGTLEFHLCRNIKISLYQLHMYPYCICIYMIQSKGNIGRKGFLKIKGASWKKRLLYRPLEKMEGFTGG